MKTGELFIGGNWRPPVSGETYATINPATEEESARVAKGDERDVDLAVVSPDFARMGHRKLMDLLVEAALAVDPRIEVRLYTPRDFKEARPTNFLGHILKHGKIVYRGGKFLL